MTGKINCQNTVITSCIRDHLYNHLYLYLVITLVLLTSLSIAPLSSAVSDKSELMKLITENVDPHINVNDLAFLLVTHNFDAAPKKDFVEVRIDKTVYKLVPNEPTPGLINVTIES